MVWYNDKDEIEKTIRGFGLFGLNEVAEARRKAHYNRREDLDEFVLLGNYWADSCGNLGKILHDEKNRVPNNAAPLVITSRGWDVISKSYGIEGTGHSLTSGCPTPETVCDKCGHQWTIKDCFTAIEVHTKEEVSLDLYVGKSLTQVDEDLRRRYQANVFLDPSTPIFNPSYEGMKNHLKYTELKIVNGWILDPDKNQYHVHAGDVGDLYIWYYRCPTCHSETLLKDEMAYFDKVFRDAGHKEIQLTAIDNEYCKDRMCCAPWFTVDTEVGIFKIGWRKRVIELDMLLLKNTPKREFEFERLFAAEKVTKGGHSIHAWGTEKAVEYLTTIREASK